MNERDDEFLAYARVRSSALRRTAYLLCGDWHAADDLVQTALTKLYVAWPRVERRDGVDAYARTILLRSYFDERSRKSSSEVVVAEVPDRAASSSDVHDRLELMRGLAALPKGQRAVLVLRYWEDLDVASTAAALNCSVGNVKSQTNRGLQALRRVFAERGLTVSVGVEEE